MNAKYELKKIKKETLEMLETQEMINNIIKINGESEKLNLKYEELNKKISENIRLIQELEQYI